MNNCPNCGANVNSDDIFCKVCGTKVSMQSNGFLDGTQQTNNSLSTNNATYKLTLHRPKAFVGSLINLKIYIDSKKECILKNGETVTINITGGNHHISFSGYSECTLQILGDATAKVMIITAREILLQDLTGANIIETETDSYNQKTYFISDFIVASSIILFIPSLFFTQFMSSITILLLIIIADIILTLICMMSAKKQQSKLKYSFKKIMTTYVGALIINVVNIIICLIINRL